MLEKFASLGAYNYLYAAVLAFFITYIIMKLVRIKVIVGKDELKMDIGKADKRSVMERCTKLFPIETIDFKGRIFKKGMNVRITTKQKKVFQGEFVGKNDMNVICILTGEHIIAHEIEKITEMISLDETK